MSNNDLISVIIPVYNVEQYLNRCVDSVINQTYKNLEIILVDDGSTDNSGKICDEYALKDNRIMVVHKKNGGAGSARNAGLDIAKGEYIGFVDSDDYIEPDMYEFLYDLLLQNKADVSCCNMFDYKDGSYIPSSNLQMDGFFNLEQMDGFFNLEEVLCLKGGLYVWNKLFLRNSIGNLRFNEKLKFGVEDLYFNFEILKKIKNIIFSKKAKYYYWDNRNSLTRKKQHKRQKRQILDLIEFYDEAIKYCKENKMRKVIDNYKKRLFYWIIKFLFIISQDKCEQEESLKFLLQYVRKEITYWLFGNCSIKTKIFLLLSCINFNLASKIYRLILKLKLKLKLKRVENG